MATTAFSILAGIDIHTHLRGRAIYLQPLEEWHREVLWQLAKDQRIWEFTRTLLLTESYDRQFDDYFDVALRLPEVGGQAFVVRSTGCDTLIGMTRFHSVEPENKALEIGYTWYVPAVWGTVVNKECKLLLLQHAFETLRFNRVQFRVVLQNIRSQKAVEKIGGVREGVLRKTGYRMDGSIRSTVIFSIIDEEWPVKKERLLRLISNDVLAEENN